MEREKNTIMYNVTTKREGCGVFWGNDYFAMLCTIFSGLNLILQLVTYYESYREITKFNAFK